MRGLGEVQHDGVEAAARAALEIAKPDAPILTIQNGLGSADLVADIVGSDRIAANGDVANKIGTYGLAVAARHHGVKFMVAAPTSTIDLATADGAGIPIEERQADEVLQCSGRRIAAAGAGAWNPVFDVTPADLVDAIVTERGIIQRPDRGKLAAHMR